MGRSRSDEPTARAGTKAVIDVKDLVHGGVYRISSRNLVVGVWNAPVKGFIGVRRKFDSEYLFTEYDWSTGPPHGTARALVKLAGPQGFELDERDNQELFDYLKVLHDAVLEQLAKEDDEWSRQQEEWKQAHPHAYEADTLRRRATLRRKTFRRYRQGIVPAGLAGLLDKSLGAGQTKHLRDRMRHHEKLAVKEFGRVSDLRAGDPPA